jgi:hypothetical protein
VHDEAEMEAAIAAFARESAGGLIAAPDAFINARRQSIMALAERYRLPTIYGFRQFVTERADLLWTGYHRHSSAFGLVCRSHHQGREGG